MPSLRDTVTSVWYGTSPGAGVVRTALRPLSSLYGGVVAARNAYYDRVAPARSPIPALSVGNLSVGGTGKTPVSAWFAARLRERGARPNLVLRGYGDDEWRVHQLLNPDIPVERTPDRRVGVVTAQAAGADCVVLDDGFQHRRAARVSDVVLLSADRWNGRLLLVPAGPFREPMSALRRATAVVVTVKAAAPAQINGLLDAIHRSAPGVPTATVRLIPEALHRASPPDELEAHASVDAMPADATSADATSADAMPADAMSADALRGRRVGVVSALADPDAFERQLRDQGAIVSAHLSFPDHHHFTDEDVTRVSRVLHGVDLVVCTLKDAVKLAPLWPRAATPLWYVSQTLVVDQGADVLEREYDRVLAAR